MRILTATLACGALAVACGISTAAAGQANASVVPDTGTGPSTLCIQGQEFCDYNSGWMTYGDGGCEVDTTADFNSFADTMTVAVEVKSPYLFAGCTAVSTVHFQYYDYPLTFSSAGFWGYACSETDFTCTAPHADPGTWDYGPTATGIPADLANGISGIWVTDTT